jgi:hypothetical protein
MSVTADEFIIEGFNNAEMAESADLGLDQAHSLFKRSIWCFEQAGNHELCKSYGPPQNHTISVRPRLTTFQ